MAGTEVKNVIGDGYIEDTSKVGSHCSYTGKESKMMDQYTHQKITFGGLIDSSIAQVVSNDVVIVPSTDNRISKPYTEFVTLKEVVDYSWNATFYSGPVLAIHMSGKYIAFGADTRHEPNGLIRIKNLSSKETACVRPMRGVAQDVAFALKPKPVLLACVVEIGDVYIYELSDSGNFTPFSAELVIQIKKDLNDDYNGLHRIIWCPYIPDEEGKENVGGTDDEDSDVETSMHDPAEMFVVTRGNRVDLWYIPTVKHDRRTSVVGNDKVRGFVQIQVDMECENSVISCSFSPDGSTIAVTTTDGYVTFYKIDIGHKHNCITLHKWNPHNGKPVTMLFFLDDHRTYNPEAQFWKFAITGADNNTELKIWTCESWSCLQTLHFAREKLSETLQPHLDLSGSYMTLLDGKHNVLYLLHFDNNDDTAAVGFVCEIYFPFVVKSLAISDAELLFPTHENDDTHRLKLFVCQMKCIQECHIVYNINNAMVPSFIYPNGLNEEKLKAENTERKSQSKTNDMENTDVILGFTPEEFINLHAEPKNLKLLAVESENHSVDDSSDIIFNHHTDVSTGFKESEDDVVIPVTSPNLSTSERYFNIRNSPSREIKEILGLNDDDDDDDENNQTQNDVNVSNRSQSDPLLPFVTNVTSSRNVSLESKMSNVSENKSPFTSMPSSRNVSLEPKITNTYQTASPKNCPSNNTTEYLENEFDGLGKHLTRIVNKLEQQEKNMKIIENRVLKIANVSIKQEQHIKDTHQILDNIKNEVTKKCTHTVQTEIQSFQDNFYQRMMHEYRKVITEALNSAEFAQSVGDFIIPYVLADVQEYITTAVTDLIVPQIEKFSQDVRRNLEGSSSITSKELINEYGNITSNKSSQIVEKINEYQTASLMKVAECFKGSSKTLIDQAVIRIEKRLSDSISQTMEKQKSELKEFILAKVVELSKTSTRESEAALCQQIVALAAQGKYNNAFQKALLAFNTKVLLFLCSKLDPITVFANPKTLHQQLLLSLLQQLSATDLSVSSDLKFRYMESAILNLDKNDPENAEHFVKVLGEVKRRFKSFLSSSQPAHKLHHSVKMLLMAIDSLLAPNVL